MTFVTTSWRNNLKKSPVFFQYQYAPTTSRGGSGNNEKWKQKRQINLNVIQIQTLRNSSMQRVAITKSPHYAKKKTYQRQLHQRFPKGKKHLILKAILLDAACVNQLIRGSRLSWPNWIPKWCVAVICSYTFPRRLWSS